MPRRRFNEVDDTSGEDHSEADEDLIKEVWVGREELEVRLHIANSGQGGRIAPGSTILSSLQGKVVYIVRHAQGQHNVSPSYDYDPPLTQEGHDQVTNSAPKVSCTDCTNRTILGNECMHASR